MKILYHHRTNGDGAEGIHVAEIIAALRKLGHEVRLICPRSARREPGLDAKPRGSQKLSAERRLPPRIRQALELAYNTVSYRRAQQALAEFQPDFVYERYSSYNFGGVLAAYRAKVPLILEVNATYTGKFGSSFPVAYPRSLRRIEQYDLRHATGIVAVSEALKEDIVLRGVAPERICVSPNAIDPQKASKVQRTVDGAGIRAKYGWSDEHTIVGFVGSLRVWHGIDFLAAAIPDICRRVPQARFLIVGSGEYRDELARMIRAHRLESIVQLAGAVPHHQVFPYMSAMDIGVMPDSNPFGSPMKVLEYMAMQVVPVAPSLGPMHEIIEHDVTGKLFARRVVPSFVDGIVELCLDSTKRSIIALQTQDYVLRERTWAHNAQDILKLLAQTQGRQVPDAEAAV